MVPPGLAFALAAVLLVFPVPALAQPAAWVTVGGQATLERGQLVESLGIEGGVRLLVGVHLLRLGPLLLGADAEGTGGRVTADLGQTTDKVTVYRARLGLRASWSAEEDEPYLVPYARAGAVFRSDRGEVLRDRGFGWYVVVGVDYRLSDVWSLGPFAGYEAVQLSPDRETLLVGLGLTFSF